MDTQSLKDGLIIIAFSTNILLQTTPIRKILFTTLKHGGQWAYDTLPTEPIDIFRKKTLITQIPIQWGTLGCNARLAHFLTKSVFLTEIGVNGKKMQDDVSQSINKVFSSLTLPEHIDNHTLTALIAFIISSILYYLVIKTTDIKAELMMNK